MRRTTRSSQRGALMITALTLGTPLFIVSCDRRPTELWVIVDSNIATTGSGPLRIDGVRIVGRTASSTEPSFELPFSLLGSPPSYALPGHTVIRPDRGADESRTLALVVSGELLGREVVRQTARVSFARDRRLVVRMFLAAECVGERQQECERMGLTCGEGGQCIPIDRPMLDEYGAEDGGRTDATAPPDAMVNQGTCAAPAPIMTTPGLAAPRLLWPPVGSTTTTKNPTIRWENAAGITGARVEFCSDRPCTRIVATLDQSGTEGRLPCELPSGVVFFRARAIGSMDAYGADTSPTWQMRIPLQIASTMMDPAETAHGCDTDFDGDGLADLVVGVGTTMRELRLYRGQRGGIPSMGSVIGMMAYNSISVAGDVNGDGFVDLVIGNSQVTPNSARVFFGAASSPLSMATSVTLTPMMTGQFGFAVAGGGDVDGDGYGDILVGAPQVSSSVGQALLYYGTPAPGMSLTASFSWTGTAMFEQLGSAVSITGDVNGDRISDFALGAPFGEPADDPQNQGQIRVYHGARNRSHINLGVVTGGSRNAHLGRGASIGGDGDGDGLADLIGSAPEFEVGAMMIGQVVFQRSTGMTISTTSSPLMTGNTAANVGIPVAHVGDFDGDGFGEMLFHGPASTGEMSQGLQMVRGAAARASFMITTISVGTNQRFTGNLGALGDVDGDGRSDFAVVFQDTTTMAERLLLVRFVSGSVRVEEVLSGPMNSIGPIARWH